MEDFINNYFQDSVKSFEKIIISKTIKSKIIKTVDNLFKTFNNGNILLIAGNGGSAADAQHLAAELVVRYNKERKALPAIAWTTDSSIITAASNDYSFEDIFARQVDAIGKENDMLILFSTSGNSLNVIKAARIAKKKNIKTVLFTGEKQTSLYDIFDIEINAPSYVTAYIQQCHLAIIHVICSLIDQKYDKKNFNYE